MGRTITDRTTTTIMAIEHDTQSLLRLMTWLSPAFPVGAFAYSGGLEAAARDGIVLDASDLQQWLETLLRNGSIWNDAVLLAEAWRSCEDQPRLAAVTELATALAGSAERHLEITAQGAAFIEAAGAWPHPVLAMLDRTTPYCIAVGAAAAANGVPLEHTLAAYLHALISQLVSSGIRLSVLGQRQGVAMLATLEPDILDVAACASRSTLDDLGSATMMADLMAIRHETIHTRLFRS
ncbi:MAG: ureF [Rhizobium sp.]|nr:ureF [Rhizobium sp.]